MSKRTHTMLLGQRRDDAGGKVFGEVFSQEGKVLKAPPISERLGLIHGQARLCAVRAALLPQKSG